MKKILAFIWIVILIILYLKNKHTKTCPSSWNKTINIIIKPILIYPHKSKIKRMKMVL